MVRDEVEGSVGMDSNPYLREISVCSLFYAIEFYHLLAKYKALQEKYLTL